MRVCWVSREVEVVMDGVVVGFGLRSGGRRQQLARRLPLATTRPPGSSAGDAIMIMSVQ